MESWILSWDPFRCQRGLYSGPTKLSLEFLVPSRKHFVVNFGFVVFLMVKERDGGGRRGVEGKLFDFLLTPFTVFLL